MMIQIATTRDIPAISKVHVDTWRSTYQGIVSDTYLEKLSYTDRERRWQKIFARSTENSSFTYVAKNAQGDVVGFANGCPERTGKTAYQGELTSIYILKAHQGRGIGRCLLQAVANKLEQLELTSMLVWVLVENPACEFYLALGGQEVCRKEIEVGGKKLVEVAYGWKDTTMLKNVDCSI